MAYQVDAQKIEEFILSQIEQETAAYWFNKVRAWELIQTRLIEASNDSNVVDVKDFLMDCNMISIPLTIQRILGVRIIRLLHEKL